MAYSTGAADDLLPRFLAQAISQLDELQRHDGSYDQTFVRLHLLCHRSG